MSATASADYAPVSFAALFNPQDPNPVVIIMCALAATAMVIGAPIWMMSQ